LRKFTAKDGEEHPFQQPFVSSPVFISSNESVADKIAREQTVNQCVLKPNDDFNEDNGQ
jgi:hypothetical protein